MQWAPSLLLLLGAVAVESLICHNKVRRSTTLNGLQNTSWGGNANESCQGNWTACARWLTNFSHEWEDYYDGCNNESKAKYYETTQLVQKYCADRSDTGCTSTQFFTWQSLEHKPTHLCCCFDDMCNATFAMQQALATSTQKPPTGSKKKYTCEASMRNATTPDRLLNATAVYNRSETCEAAWAPCVEFVYKNEADGLWRQWRAGCSYKYESVNYADIVDQFCTASDQCKQFDMIEPSTRVIGNHGTFVYTQAYACCCSGTGCNLPDTVSVAQTTSPTPSTLPSTTSAPSTPPSTTSITSPPTTSTTGSTKHTSTGASTSTSQYSPPSTVGPASASTARPATTEPPDAAGFPFWLLIVIAIAATFVGTVAATVYCARREMDDDGLLPASLSAKLGWLPNKPDDAAKSGAKSTQMAESPRPTASSSSAASKPASQPSNDSEASSLEGTSK